MVYFSTDWLLNEEEKDEEERVDHVFPLLTSPLRHVPTWFSLECCFCGIADGKAAGGFICGEQGNIFTPPILSRRLFCVDSEMCFHVSREVHKKSKTHS